MPSSNNIFLNTDNLAFSLPLISVCLCYAYFKYVPLQYALSILGVLFVLYQIRSYSQARRNKKFVHLDESTIQDLAGDDDADEAQSKKQQELAAKQRKAHNRLQMRLAQEKKAQNKQSNKKKENAEDHMDDDDAMLTFAKGSRDASKKKK